MKKIFQKHFLEITKIHQPKYAKGMKKQLMGARVAKFFENYVRNALKCAYFSKSLAKKSGTYRQ